MISSVSAVLPPHAPRTPPPLNTAAFSHRSKEEVRCSDAEKSSDVAQEREVVGAPASENPHQKRRNGISVLVQCLSLNGGVHAFAAKCGIVSGAEHKGFKQWRKERPLFETRELSGRVTRAPPPHCPRSIVPRRGSRAQHWLSLSSSR